MKAANAAAEALRATRDAALTAAITAKTGHETTIAGLVTELATLEGQLAGMTEGDSDYIAKAAEIATITANKTTAEGELATAVT